jgi:glycosyltransferase involved in cell wall biosynthesis
VGRVLDQSFNKLLAYKNVEWRKPVSYEELPAIINAFDIGLIPFVKSKFTEKIYPLKINEYMALGKPVVMTSFADLPEFKDYVLTGDYPDTFSDAIQLATLSKSASAADRRRAIARQNSWKERANQFQGILCEQLNENRI